MTRIVEVYTRPGCMQCAATKRWLNQRGITYIEHDADDYADYLTHVLGCQALPVVEVSVIPAADTNRNIGREHVTHWSQYRTDKLENLLEGENK